MCEWCYVAPLLFMHPIHGSQGPQRANSCRQADMLRTSATSLKPSRVGLFCSGCSSSPGTTQRLLSSTKRSPKRSRSFFVQRLRVYRGKSVANKALPSCEGEADVVNLSSTRKGWPLGAQ